MKSLGKRLMALIMSVVLMVAAAPSASAATYKYAVDGGNLYFNPTTGTITDCDSSVYNADIPSEIYGIPVTTIGKNAFSYCKKLVSVTIPNTVTSIGNRAFDFCTALRTVEISDSITSIDSECFNHCDSLESIEIPSSMKNIEKNIISGCEELKTIKLCEGIETIKYLAWKCHALETIAFPNSVKSIEGSVVNVCKNLKSVTFGTGLEFIGGGAIADCDALESIYFTGDAPATGGSIIRGKATPIIYYPEGASGWGPTWNGYITKSYKPAGSTTTKPVEQAPIEETKPVEEEKPVVQNTTSQGQQADSWALSLVNEAIAGNLMPDTLGTDLRKNITRAQFASIQIKLYEAMSGDYVLTPAQALNPFTDTDDPYVRKAYSLGMVSGTSATTFGPDELLTREQAAVMLAAVYRQLGGTIVAGSTGGFRDDVAISGWAREAVYFMSENGIVTGVGNNVFDSQSNAQSQAALIMALRMLQNFK